MQAISELKEQPVTETPLIVFDCVLSNGQVEHWCTHTLTAGANTYAARVIQHSAFDIQTASDQGIDGSPRRFRGSLLANADSHFRNWNGQLDGRARTLTVGFLFYDLPENAATYGYYSIISGNLQSAGPQRRIHCFSSPPLIA